MKRLLFLNQKTIRKSYSTNYINKRSTCKNRIRALCKEDGELTIESFQIANLLNEKFFSAYSNIVSQTLLRL